MRAGEAAYEGGFIEHYLLPILYPPGLTRGTQIVLGLIVLAINLAVYGVPAAPLGGTAAGVRSVKAARTRADRGCPRRGPRRWWLRPTTPLRKRCIFPS